MSSMNDSVETVNAAATAIVSAESRVQPTSVEKRRWSSCWSLYWCFGSFKQNKRIGHALVVPESNAPGPTAPTTETANNSTTVVFPFIAPPSSPASFLQSEPPSASYSPVGKSLAQNPPSSIFTVGPYAYETQLVSPPVFSTYNTEPSTASFTPPPEPLQTTTPSSPEVPFAQLLTSSLARARRNSIGSNRKYEFQPYHAYPESPGSTMSNSGTSSPFPDKRNPILGYEYLSTRKWGSRLGSGSVTPNGLGSTMDSGSVTPYGLGSRLDSGSVTPYGLGSGSLTPNGLGSRLGSGTLTPNGMETYLMETQISEVASLANSETGSQKGEALIDHRVSFELTHTDVSSSQEKNLDSSFRTIHENTSLNLCECCVRRNSGEASEKSLQCCCKRQSVSRDFNFDNRKGAAVEEKPPIGTEWWTSEEPVGAKSGSQSNWTFFPMLQTSFS